MEEMYPVDAAMVQDLGNRFMHHPPIEGSTQEIRYSENRGCLLDAALLIAGRCPRSRELSLAMTHLEEACFWANAAIARHEGP